MSNEILLLKIDFIIKVNETEITAFNMWKEILMKKFAYKCIL